MTEVSTGLVARCRALPGNARGALWMLLACSVFSAQGVTVKMLGTRLDSFQIAFFRCAVGLLTIEPFIVGPYLTQGATALFMTGRPWVHLARALVGVAGLFCGFYAVLVASTLYIALRDLRVGAPPVRTTGAPP